MLKGKFTRKAIAATFLIILLTETIAPAASYALTSGPTAPEATSFEPVDTTDMVNVQTGDLTYNIPLMEVPGPEGGYPLSLSYHAGIQPNEDASWVGLGWTLNTGAVNRNVNGYPDDWYSPTTSSHVYWEGGQTSVFKAGISTGLSSKTGVTAGLSFSNDTYRGFGVGLDIGIGYSIARSGDSKINANIGIGVSPYGDGYLSGGIGGKSGKDITGSLNANFSTNFESLNVGASGGIGYNTNSRWGSVSLLGASIGTSGNKPSLSVGGLSANVSNGNASNISTSSSGFGVDIPTPWGFSLSLGYSKQRYWTNETVGVATHGSLQTFAWSDPSNQKAPDNIAYDAYALLEDPSYKNIIDYPDPKAVQGGSFPDFDIYSVSAQGLGGNMRPFLFQAEILNQNIRLSSTQSYISYFAPKTGHFLPHFRFENDFSNSYRQNYTPYSNPASVDVYLGQQPFDPSPQYGNNDGTYGFNGALVGSKNVYTGVKVHPSQSLGYTGPRSVESLEGFSITNETGVTYHYGLPAYSWGEENYQEKIDKTIPNGGKAISRQTKLEPYAYTWYLTTVTGPDFVDRNLNGIADAGDWGYWVNFEYGKWSNDYVWRNPSEGYRRDEDGKWQNCSIGHKEIFYLNAIRTRTHTALFEKDLRLDGKGVSPQSFGKNTDNGIPTDYDNNGRFNVNSSQSLKLNRIYLVNSSDGNFVTSSSGNSSSYIPSRTVTVTGAELPNNVLDKNDVDAAGRTVLESKSIRIIDFNSDYSLCPNTSNSFNSFNYSSGTDLISYNGKLTLNSVQMRGKGGIALVPPTNFNYELSGDEIKTGSGTFTDLGSVVNQTIFTFTSSAGFEVGDMINISTSSKNPWIIKSNPSTNTYTTSLVRNNELEQLASPGATNCIVTKTKNPSYKSNASDFWGMFKDDYDPVVCKTNENLGRQTTAISSKNVDVWSLRKISTPLGSNIKLNYESDQYKSVLNSNGSLLIDMIGSTHGVYADSKVKIYFGIDVYNDVINNLTVGDKLNFLSFQQCDGPFPSETQYIPVDSRDVYINSTPQITGFNNSERSVTTDAGFYDYFFYAQLHPGFPAQLAPGQFQRGNLLTGKELRRFGGGLRVSSIEMQPGSSGSIQTTVYDYSRPDNNLQYGFTTFEPTILDIDNVNNLPYVTTDQIKSYRKKLYKDINNLLAISRESPSPGVMYEYVKVTRKIKNGDEASARFIEGSTQYQFEVFRSNMIGRIDLPVSGSNTVAPGRTSASVYNGNYYETIRTHNLAIMKFTNAIGNIKRVIQFDNNGKKLVETINNYLHDGLETLDVSNFMSQYKSRLSQYYYQGYLQERYSELKSLVNQTNVADNGVQATISARETYPAIQTGQTIINYVNGTSSSGKNIEFDFYSGAVVKAIEIDAYGNSFMTQTIPAYRKYPVMGPKIAGNTNANKNMLTQTTGSYTYRVDGSNNKLGLVSASVSTWSNQVSSLGIDGTAYLQNSSTNGDVWRMQSNYFWMPDTQTADGLTTIAGFTDFNWPTPSTSVPAWKKSSEVTLYDVYSKALEAKDINGNLAATHLDYEDKKVVLTGSPANYYEIAYSGAEDAGVSQANNVFVHASNGVVSSGPGVSHTGAKSLLLGGSGKKGFVYTVPTNKLVAGKNYVASVWVKPGCGTGTSDVKLYYDINGVIKGNSISSGTSTKTANGWIQISLNINGADIVAGSTLNVGCRNDHASLTAYVDDIRFQPLNAQTVAYVYDGFSGELTHILDNNNIYTRFEYDAVGRLIRTYKEKLSIGEFRVNENLYNYGSYGAGSVYLSSAINTSFAKNDCLIDCQSGSLTVVNIPSGKYKSYTSQLEADAQAIADAQAQANSKGTCSAILIWNSDAISENYFSQNCGTDTPDPYYVNIAAGAYTSTISKLDANNKAKQQAQNQANNFGTCTAACTCSGYGEGWACVYGQCEQGIKVYTDQWSEFGTWYCIYHWEFSDGTWSSEGQEVSGSHCY